TNGVAAAQVDPPVAPPVATPAHATSEPATPIAVEQSAPESASARASPSDPASAAPSPSHTASPAAQLAPALVQMGHAPDGATRLTVRLDPPELGHVEVKIERPAEAPARVEITVERPETLTLLLRDQPQLQRALDQAGVPAEGRSVTFHVATQEAAQRSEPATAPAPGVAAGGPSSDGSHGAPRHGGQPRRQDATTADLDPIDLAAVAPSGWVRGGIDITA
ncbi:MAG TPA: flagellar hook-length control protein FliK, partial [Acetobacteraceae bacterium]|nr:flagellar hook-length control protein FliK [Acetobacteraceae bacterium]